MIIKLLNIIKHKYYYSQKRLNKLTQNELLAIIRHDCHRIEKSVYNNIFEIKRNYFEHKKDMVLLIFSILKKKDWYSEEHPVINWALNIIENFDDIEKSFIAKFNNEAPIFHQSKSDQIIDQFKTRRSCRTWEDEDKQPRQDELRRFALKMIDAARWSPNSGNRQAWKFAILTDKNEKYLLKGLKEKHCYSAPLVIFIGMDSRFYSPAYHLKDCLYIDAGAAIMQMVNIANFSGIGVCWNHLSEDLIKSRKQNVNTYNNFCKKMKIPNYIKPVALLSVGKVKYLPPVPARLEIQELIL